ncbi:hypothetical protein C8Q80DRAFT_1348067 [Daedaleopsis nitida]|nr:hypothetical protein C8Q80DRAFT_1348067 [Daedaleopsis nitida]
MANARENTPRGPVFVAGGQPVKFYLWSGDDEHASWGLTDGQRDALRQKIEANGGVVVKRAHKAHTVIVQEHGVEPLREEYVLLRRYVEPPTFVRQCLRRGRYEHGRVEQHPLGGRLPAGEDGRESYRVEFTDADDEHLCQFLARAIPDKEQGGRQGNRLWMRLLEMAQKEPEYKWAKRHPWTSWQNRYKKRMHIFDPRIAEIAERNPPSEDGQGVYPYSRRENGRSRLLREFMRAQRQQPRGGEDAEEEDRARGEEEDEEFCYFDPFAEENQDEGVYEEDAAAAHKQVAPPAGRARRRAQPTPPPAEDEEEEEEEEYEFEPHEPGPSGTQRTPSLSPAVPSPPPPPRPRARVQIQKQQQKVAPRPARIRDDSGARAAQGPMSSQATLVGPVPTQLRGVPQSQQRQATAGPGPSTAAQRRGKRKAIEEQEEMEIAMDIDADEEEEQEVERSGEDADDDGEGNSAAAELGDADDSELLPQTNEDERDVEAILQDQDQEGGSAQSGRLSPEVLDPDAMDVDGDGDGEDELASDDERIDAVVPRLNLTASAAEPRLRGPSAMPTTPRIRGAAVGGRRGASPTSSDRSVVPLENTRASTEKRRMERGGLYVAPAGTRAAELSMRVQQGRTAVAPGTEARASRPDDGDEAFAHPATPFSGKQLRSRKVLRR